MTASLPTIDPSLPEGTGLELPPLHARFAQGSLVWFRSVPVPYGSPFWNVWKARKLAFLERGFSTRKDGNTWILDQWLAGRTVGGRLQDGFYYLTPIGVERLERAKSEQSLPPALVKTEPVFAPLPSHIESKLRPYQVQPARQLLRALRHGRAEWGYPGAVALCDMGTGKTYHTLAAALTTGRKVVVFCPPVGKGGWQRAFKHFGAEPHFIESYEAVRGAWRQEIATMDATGQFHWSNANEMIVILDECQALRHDDTLNYRCFSALIRQGVPCIAASATLALSPVEMKFAGRLVGLHQGGTDWDRFCATHGCERKSKSKPWVWNKDLRHLRRINEALFPYRGCRIRKMELGDQCPETEIQVLPVFSLEAATIEEDMQVSEKTIQKLEANNAPKGKIQALRRNLRMAIWKKCETALIPEIARRVAEDVANGWSVAIFVNFTETRETLGRLLGTTAGFYGGQSPKVRAEFERKFQNEEIHILISNLRAGGASVSLHDVNGRRSRRAYIFPSDDVIPMEQATGRVDRVGGLSKSEQFIPCLSGTRMVQTVKRIRQKMLQISTLNDGSDAGGARF